MQKNDPLATQIWKLYSKTKTQLPNQERMENLTWRMMAMSLKRKEREQARVSQQKSSAPSGIAKLRQSIDHANIPPSDPMNLDDFIFPNSIASPAGISPSPPDGRSSTLFNTRASAIPIKNKKDVQDQSHPTFPPASAPIPPQLRHRNHEFNYVQRRVRKTSIDEGRARKRRAEFSPQVPPVNSIMIPNEPDADAGLNNYSLDHTGSLPSFSQHVSTHPHVPFHLDTFGISDDPILHSAGPFQQNFSFSPTGSPIVHHGPFSIYNQTPMGSSLNSADYYSPPGSAFPSTASTPQPMHDGEHVYFDHNGIELRHQRPLQNFSSNRPSNLSNSMQPHYIYDPNHESMFTAVTTAGPMQSYNAAGYPLLQQHINPSHVLHSGYSNSQSPGMPLARQDNLFSFGGDSDNEEEEGIPFGDRS
ncbi:MAG: hypothetical protein Q9187_009411, partial [Circinaria calcarea]